VTSFRIWSYLYISISINMSICYMVGPTTSI